ncbi:MAG: hypothetical protein ACE5JD_15670 [Candidatus Methylomirabilia bacterium]
MPEGRAGSVHDSTGFLLSQGQYVHGVDGSHAWYAGGRGMTGACTICRRLQEHVERRRGGEVFVEEGGFVLNLPNDPERVRAPDVLPGLRIPLAELFG